MCGPFLHLPLEGFVVNERQQCVEVCGGLVLELLQRIHLLNGHGIIPLSDRRKSLVKHGFEEAAAFDLGGGELRF